MVTEWILLTAEERSRIIIYMKKDNTRPKLKPKEANPGRNAQEHFLLTDHIGEAKWYCSLSSFNCQSRCLQEYPEPSKAFYIIYWAPKICWASFITLLELAFLGSDYAFLFKESPISNTFNPFFPIQVMTLFLSMNTGTELFY